MNLRGRNLTLILAAAFSALISLPGFSQLLAGGDTTICQGGQAQLTATGGGASYYWTSVPFDPSLLIPQQQNPIVSPQVSTMYVVQSNIATGNLILNGSFELGVMGFSSDYLNNQTSIQAEGTYAVVTDAHTVHPNFYCNQDHTSGSGKFMAVNGSGVPNVRVWYLNIPTIIPHHQYEFSTWITSLHSTNPALLQFSINGELVAEPFQAYPTTCDWYQFFYVWESDTNTHANISIVNQNTILSGNDFALDDISFATVTVHYDTVWVTVQPLFTSEFAVPESACAQETINVTYSGNAPDTADYHWDFDGATIISGTGQGPYEIRYETMGNHHVSLFVTGDGCPSDTTEWLVVVGESPLVNVSADATFIPYGTSTVLHGSYTGGQGPFAYWWEPAGLLLDPASLDPQTVGLAATTEFFLYVNDESAQCTGFESITIEVTGGPLGLYVTASPEEICQGGTTVLNADASGGTGSYTYSWTSDPPGFSSDLPSPAVAPVETTTYHVSIFDGLSSVEGSVTVTLNPLPMANAGNDKIVAYGTPAVLDGSASGGSGNYSWHWSPEEWLVSPDQQSPATLNITGIVVFTLIVTDNETGCVSEGDQVVVQADGGPLNVLIQAEATEICQGEEITLTALANGGNQGHYSFLWSDEFGNSYPEDSAITVSPDQSTEYHVIVSDVYTTSEGDFILTVYPAGDFTLAGGQAIIYACPYDTVLLVPSPHPEEWTYLWSNGAVNDSLLVGSTGLGYDSKSFTLDVETENGCPGSQQITIIFDFANCFGVSEHNEFLVGIFPNPGKGNFTISWQEAFKAVRLHVYDLQSRQVFTEDVGNKGPGNEIKVDLSHLPPGLYYLRLTGVNSSVSGKLLVIP